MKNKKVIITADDLGISESINIGIIETYQKGILSSSALLMNTPATLHGIKLAKENPGLEIGIHLSIVEGMSLRKKSSSVTDKLNYFNNEICLIRDWKTFIKAYFLKKIDFNELEEELELQIQEFLRHFKSIPFANGTQHMHLMPKVLKIIIKLSKKYNIKAIRVPAPEKPSVLWFNKRMPFLIPFQFLGLIAKRKLKKANIKYACTSIGMQFSGKIDENKLLLMLRNLPFNTVEIIMHPGYESKELRDNLPWAYSEFNWDIERKALLSEKVKKYIENNDIEICKFTEI